MLDVSICRKGDEHAFAAFCDGFAERRPGRRFGRFDVRGDEAVLRSDGGGTRIFWIYAGEGEVFLPSGFRTTEGDGRPLPDAYSAEPMAPRLREAVDILSGALERIAPAAQPAVQVILSRVLGDVCIGDFANELWKLEHTAKPWTVDARAFDALQTLFLIYRECGYSVKSIGSFEPVMAGDQLAVQGDATLRVRGRFSCLTFACDGPAMRPIPPAMRLRYLKDTSGGCNFDFDPFRRLPLTWFVNLPGESNDGVNSVNSHVVNIAKETSPTHFHPPAAIGGGDPQDEAYLVLDPASYGLKTYGREARLVTYPDLRELSRFEEHPIAPGDFVYIPAGTGHRGIDAFVNVITVPGFKPHNEYYIDADVQEATRGLGPCNESLAGLKNYGRIEDLL